MSVAKTLGLTIPRSFLLSLCEFLGDPVTRTKAFTRG